MANLYSQLESCYSLLDIEENIDDDDDEFFINLATEDADAELGKVFTCDLCKRSLKTERGLKRHKESHAEKASQSSEALHPLDPPAWKMLIQSTTEKIINEDLQSDSILEELKGCVFNNTEQCLPYFSEVITTSAFNAEKFYPRFVKVVTQLDSIAGLSKESSTVVGFELANQVLAHYKSLKSPETTVRTQEISTLSEREVAIVVYIAGYVFGELYRQIRKSRAWASDMNQQKVALFKAGKVEAVENDDQYQLVKCRDRGGLWYVSADVVKIFIETEKAFKLETLNLTDKIDFEKIVSSVISMNEIQSCIRNIEDACDVPVENEVLMNFLDQIILQYVRVRAHSYAKDQLQKHKQKFNISKAKGLRTELKRSADKQ